MANAYDIQDDHLLASWKVGDTTAFTRFVEKHFLSLVNTAQRKGCQWELAEELAQDAFVALYNSRVENNPFAFCRQVLKNKIIDEYRRKKITVVPSAGTEPVTGTPGGIDHAMEYEELELQLAGYIEQLPEQARKVFLLRREGNLSNREVADKLGISVKMVEAHMTKALALLKKQLGNVAFISVLITVTN
jgi:RNA polymerase sigma-70 factor (ECF subfamily)